ncbi:MAG TPA: molybdenum cofactor biosynthesis protein B [Janthinobacterium sp.]|jgi:molybdenum cofactor biosynthesis protein B|nr:molybdenum cofactor biosynthesis protein B [Janthinobacterium sp.]
MKNKNTVPSTPISLACAVLTVSDTRTTEDDSSGDLLSDLLTEAGHRCVRRDIVRDDVYQIRRVLSDWIADDEVQIVLSNGATGFSHADSMPEAAQALFDKEIVGFGELFRRFSFTEVGASTVQSRALAGYANNTLIFCLPGSGNACHTAWQHILREQLDSTTKPCNFATQFLR